jgi:hypothetical protein
MQKIAANEICFLFPFSFSGTLMQCAAKSKHTIQPRQFIGTMGGG